MSFWRTHLFVRRTWEGSGRSDKAWLPYQQEDINPQTLKPLDSAALLHTPSETLQSFILPSQPLADLYHSLQRQRRRWAREEKGEPCIRPEKNSAPRAPLITHIHHWQKVGQWKSWQLQRLQVPRSQKQPELPECVPGFGPMNGGVHTRLMSERPSSRDESTARLAFGKEGIKTWNGETETENVQCAFLLNDVRQEHQAQAGRNVNPRLSKRQRRW